MRINRPGTGNILNKKSRCNSLENPMLGRSGPNQSFLGRNLQEPPQRRESDRKKFVLIEPPFESTGIVENVLQSKEKPKFSGRLMALLR
jgi:hypothetical protein